VSSGDGRNEDDAPVPEVPPDAGAPAPEPTPEAPTPARGAPSEASPPAPEPEPPPQPEPEAEPEHWLRVGQVATGRRLTPLDDDTLQSIRHFAETRHLPGVGTLQQLAEAGPGAPGLSVQAFTELRQQLGRLLGDVESIAIHAGPVLFLKTQAKNQPGTALRWLSEPERRVLREEPGLLDHPGRLVATLKKRLTAQPEAD
jgi:hypothetical protein